MKMDILHRHPMKPSLHQSGKDRDCQHHCVFLGSPSYSHSHRLFTHLSLANRALLKANQVI